MTTPPMKIKCVAPWAGGKRRLAPRIVELLGPHDTYVEPFVGGCSILPVKPTADEEAVNDASPAVANVLSVMAVYSKRLCEALAPIKFERAAFDFARGYVACAEQQAGYPGYDIGAAARQLIVWWQGPGGLAGTSRKPWFAARKTKTGGDPATRWESFKASLPALCERLKRVHLGNSRWQTFLGGYKPDAPGAAYYVDPPYFAKSFRYAVDFTPDDHTELADRLNQFARARVVVSYQDDPADPGRLARLYPPRRWRRIDVEMSKSMSAARGKTTRATEVLLVNDAGGK